MCYKTIGLGLMGYGGIDDGGNAGIIGRGLTVQSLEDIRIFDIGDVDEVKAFAGVIGNFLLISDPATRVGLGGLDEAKTLLDLGLKHTVLESSSYGYAQCG